jgi:hypothetical protein
MRHKTTHSRTGLLTATLIIGFVFTAVSVGGVVEGAAAGTPDTTHKIGADDSLPFSDVTCSDVTYKQLPSGEYEINSIEQLQCIGSEASLLDRDFVLQQDIDATKTRSWDSGAGFAPIGNFGGVNGDNVPFSGTLDGNGHTISNLSMNRSQKDVALFEYTTGRVSNLTISNAALENTGIRTAVIAGMNGGGIANVTITDATIQATAYTALVAGENRGEISNTNAQGEMSTFIFSGGVTGSNTGTITGATVSVTQSPTVPSNLPPSLPANKIGGIAGESTDGGTISDVHSQGTIKGGSRVAGIVGFTAVQDGLTAIQNASTTMTVNATRRMAGGITGLLRSGEVSDVTSSATVSADDLAGGIAGKVLGGPITDARFTGPARVTAEKNSGGIVGRLGGALRDTTVSQATINGSLFVGGVAGTANATITASGCDCTVQGTQAVGGIVGSAKSSTLREVSTDGSISGEINVGGIVGVLGGGRTLIDQSYSLASVSVTSTSGGGIVGNIAGGAGVLPSIINHSYAAGNVDGPARTTGGLVGTNVGSVFNSYWDTQATGQQDSAGGTPVNTEALTGPSATETLSFDFDNAWAVTSTYPTFRQDPGPTVPRPKPVASFDSPPSDIDGDGEYENIRNGNDSDFTILDVQALFAALDGKVMSLSPHAFSFSNSKKDPVSVLDVQALFTELSSTSNPNDT